MILTPYIFCFFFVLFFIACATYNTQINEVYVSQLIIFCFARVSSHLADFNTENKILKAKLLKQGYRYHKLCYRKLFFQDFILVSKFNVGLLNLFKNKTCWNPIFMATLYI